MVDTPRKQLIAQLKPLLPKTWALIPYQDSPGVLSKVTVMFRQTTIAKTPAAPLGAYQTGFDAAILAPETDATAAENTLDDAVLTFVRMLDTAKTSWTSATKAANVGGQAFGYVVSFTIITQKE